eukprot:TRINITY_DN3179_c0_g1_i1.p1 TRINITY_DN3179_c0_g1~~TRINITY_DN3179_c0_g1_i1.p1  ORF type:complete len:262 (-),score=18.33 TRINITY_DN3179_c0_g1_i1:103-888(-)
MCIRDRYQRRVHGDIIQITSIIDRRDQLSSMNGPYVNYNNQYPQPAYGQGGSYGGNDYMMAGIVFNQSYPSIPNSTSELERRLVYIGLIFCVVIQVIFFFVRISELSYLSSNCPYGWFSSILSFLAGATAVVALVQMMRNITLNSPKIQIATDQILTASLILSLLSLTIHFLGFSSCYTYSYDRGMTRSSDILRWQGVLAIITNLLGKFLHGKIHKAQPCIDFVFFPFTLYPSSHSLEKGDYLSYIDTCLLYTSPSPRDQA